MHCPFCARLNLYCLPHSVECVQSQKELGWHACGSLGCWTSSTACAYMQRGFHSRPLVADASTDGTGAPNMFSRRSVTIESMSYPVKVQIDHRDFIQGSADGGGCNRLIHTLGQCIGDHFPLIANRVWIRAQLCKRFPLPGPDAVHPHTYLDLRPHWAAIVELLAISAQGMGFDPENVIRTETSASLAWKRDDKSSEMRSVLDKFICTY